MAMVLMIFVSNVVYECAGIALMVERKVARSESQIRQTSFKIPQISAVFRVIHVAKGNIFQF